MLQANNFIENKVNRKVYYTSCSEYSEKARHGGIVDVKRLERVSQSTLGI